MSSFKQIAESIQGLRESEVAKGIFFRPVTFKLMGEIQKAAEPAEGENEVDTNEKFKHQLFLMFQEVFCNSEGERFDDVNTPDDIDNLDISLLIDVSREVYGYLSTGKGD